MVEKCRQLALKPDEPSQVRRAAGETLAVIATDEQLAPARDFQRKAQFYLDFIEAENSMGFHAPQEAARILGESIDFTRRGQRELSKRPEKNYDTPSE